MKLGSQLPSLAVATEWLNLPAGDVPETNRRPTLVHFWSVTSKISQANLSQVAQLRDQRHREGFRVIAVHLSNEKQPTDAKTVRDAIANLNLTEPCALDNDQKLRHSFLNYLGIVPAYYLFDTGGSLQSFSAGEAGFDILEKELDRLLGELREQLPFCPQCELFLPEDAMFCSDCGLPLNLPGSRSTHPYYEKLHAASLPTIRLIDPDPLIGHIIDGKYELSARLGEGSISTVYRARRIHIGDDVAVKILRRKFVNDEAALARFRREARAAAMLRHPNVITIHDLGETAGENLPAYIVMEFVEGTPLRVLLNSENHFGLERAVRLMRAICAGVGAAHRQGVVHRDLKPENILVLPPDSDNPFENVKVVDFGLAKLLADSSAPSAGTVVGTPFYMSPEQCLGEAADARSDVYSLGAMLYEMLSGNPPFSAGTVSKIISQHLSESPPSLPNSLEIPRRIEAAIMQALAKEPDGRPQTATDLARQLQSI